MTTIEKLKCIPNLCIKEIGEETVKGRCKAMISNRAWTDWCYDVSLQRGGMMYRLTWLSRLDGKSLEDYAFEIPPFLSEEPEDAVKKAYDWCEKMGLISDDMYDEEGVTFESEIFTDIIN